MGCLRGQPEEGSPLCCSDQPPGARSRLEMGSEGLQGPVGAIAWVTLARLLGREEIICERLRAISPGLGETFHWVGAVTRGTRSQGGEAWEA